MRVGITCRDESRVWNNGLHQNAYNLFSIYKKIGVDVRLVSQNLDSKKIFDENIIHLDFKTIKDFDVILEVSESLNEVLYAKFLSSGKKVASVNYGNVLMIFNEDLVMDKPSSFAFSRIGVENWISPHFYFAKGLVKATTKKDAKICPYIWSPYFLLEASKRSNIDILDSVKKLDVNKIGILEPNINFVKNCIYPILGCESLEKRNSEKISEILVFSSDKLKTSKRFLEIIKNFDVFTNKKISFEDRYSLPFLISSKFFGTIISNNIYNDLNYLTLEALFLGMPIIHNSKFCSEAGYFYEDSFDAISIGKHLEFIIDNFESNRKQYKENAEKIIWKFSSENPDNIREYERLLNSIS